MTAPIVNTDGTEIGMMIAETAIQIAVGIASSMVPGAPMLALVITYLPQIEALVRTMVEFVGGKEATPEDLAAARLAIHQQLAVAQFHQWRLHSAAEGK